MTSFNLGLDPPPDRDKRGVKPDISNVPYPVNTFYFDVTFGHIESQVKFMLIKEYRTTNYDTAIGTLHNIMNHLLKIGNFDCGVFLPCVLEIGNNMCLYQMEDRVINFERIVKRKIPFTRLLSSDKYEFKEMVDNFYRSCVALTIFDYILGTKDRKACNIWITPTGHVLRLICDTVFDYGSYSHIPEVFITSEFAKIKELELHVPKFIDLVQSGFCILRNNFHFLIEAIRVMFGDVEGVDFYGKLPEIIKVFMLDKSEEDIKNRFSVIIENSVKSDLLYTI
jgi:hypothetical protein